MTFFISFQAFGLVSCHVILFHSIPFRFMYLQLFRFIQLISFRSSHLVSSHFIFFYFISFRFVAFHFMSCSFISSMLTSLHRIPFHLVPFASILDSYGPQRAQIGFNLDAQCVLCRDLIFSKTFPWKLSKTASNPKNLN